MFKAPLGFSSWAHCRIYILFICVKKNFHRFQSKHGQTTKELVHITTNGRAVSVIRAPAGLWKFNPRDTCAIPVIVSQEEFANYPYKGETTESTAYTYNHACNPQQQLIRDSGSTLRRNETTQKTGKPESKALWEPAGESGRLDNGQAIAVEI